MVAARTTRTVERALSVAQAVFSRGGEAPDAERLEWLAAEVSDFLERIGPRSRALLTLAIWLVTALAPVWLGRLGGFVRLPLAARVTALARMEARVPAPFLAVKAMLCLLYYEHPAARRDAGAGDLCLLPRAPREEDAT